MLSNKLLRATVAAATKSTLPPTHHANNHTKVSQLYFSTTRMSMPTLDERTDKMRGPGGRASETGIKVACFGASGFLGTYVSYELGTNAFMAYFGNRGDEYEMKHLRPFFDLGRTRFVFYSARDIDSVREVIADADIVINMIGKYYETRQPVSKPGFPYVKMQTNYTFHDTNVKIPKMIAEVCKEMQVDHLIHLSSAMARPDSKSEWARTKYEGEQEVKKAFPWATIVRPTQLFGHEDRLLNWFAQMGVMYRCIPVVEDGEAVIQPVWVADVAKTILNIVDNAHKYEGKTIDCFGPNDVTYKELAEFVNDISERNRRIVYIPKKIFKPASHALQWQRSGSTKPIITPDLVEVMTEDYLPPLGSSDAYETQHDILTMKDLGITATPIEKIAFGYVHRFRKGGHFAKMSGYH